MENQKCRISFHLWPLLKFINALDVMVVAVMMINLYKCVIVIHVCGVISDFCGLKVPEDSMLMSLVTPVGHLLLLLAAY